MSDSFQDRVIDTLARLETKVDRIVGDDGNGGAILDLELRVRRLEGHRRVFRLSVPSVIAAAVFGALDWLFHLKGH